MQFEWDSHKAADNARKHGVGFEEAAEVFDDQLFLIFADPDHSGDEDRLIIMGQSRQSRLLVVAYTERADVIRLISAREATRRERRIYAEGL